MCQDQNHTQRIDTVVAVKDSSTTCLAASIGELDKGSSPLSAIAAVALRL
jgi:hypothetical protein